jgi:hypothetical protein
MIPPIDGPAPPCPYCGGARASLTCTCLGCVDLTFSCGCDRSVDELTANEGLCERCVEAGCNATLADFARCRRLKPAGG